MPFVQILFFSLILAGFAGFLSLPVSHAETAQQIVSNMDVSLADTSATSIVSGRDIDLANVHVSGSLVAGRNITVNAGSVAGTAQAGRDLKLQDCQGLVSKLSVGRDATLEHCQVDSLTVGRAGILNHVVANGSVVIGQEAHIQNSQLQGTLTTSDTSLAIEGSQLQDIIISQAQLSGATTNTGVLNNNVVGNGNVVLNGRSSSFIQNGQSTVSVSSNSISTVNGFTIKSSGGPGVDQLRTTVITPENSIYVNGKKVDGNGPDTYEAYRAAFPHAPNVSGPGWNSQLGNLKSGLGSVPKRESLIYLKANSRVKGTIRFEDGHGIVYCDASSQVSNPVVGGKLIKTP